jgi:hypothetical protein
LSGADRFVEGTIRLDGTGKERETISISEVLLPSLTRSSIKSHSHGEPILILTLDVTDYSHFLGFVNPEAVSGTSKGRVFRISVIRKGNTGEWTISVKEFSEKSNRSSGIFSSFFGFGTAPPVPRFGASPTTEAMGNIAALGDERDGVVALSLGAVEPDGVDVWVLSASGVSVWRVSTHLAHASSISSLPATEKLMCKADALIGVQEKLLEFYGLADDGLETTEDMYAEGPAVGINLTGGLPMQMERRERQILALGAELLDIVLVRKKTSLVDPREPSSTPARDGDEMETETDEIQEELTPVLLVAFTVPVSRKKDSGGIRWNASSTTSRKTSKRKERSYATIECHFIGVEGLAGNRSTHLKDVEPTLRFGKPSILPYSDAGKPLGVTGLRRGVGMGVSVGSAPGSDPGWFAPRMTVLQATVTVSPQQNYDENAETQPVSELMWGEKTVTIFATLFEGGMVLSSVGMSADPLLQKIICSKYGQMDRSKIISS